MSIKNVHDFKDQPCLTCLRIWWENTEHIMAVAKGSLKALLRSGRKVVCIGKNYEAHITELSHLSPHWDLSIEKDPVIFLKPTTTYAFPGEPLVLPKSPPFFGEVHHELELGVIIGEEAKDVQGDDAVAMSKIAGYCVALDMTARDIQTAAKAKGMPWSVAKGYDSFLPISDPFPASDVSGIEGWKNLKLRLEVNGDLKQSCDAGTMIHSVPSLIRYVSSIMTLQPGDLLITGTPDGVGPVFAGDVMKASIQGHCSVTVKVEQKK